MIDQESDPNPNPKLLQKENTMTTSENSKISAMDEDLHWPIALRKGVRSYTQHPIHNYISYKGLSPNFRTFVSNINKVQVPRTILEAF